MTLFALPTHALDGARAVWGTVDRIWEALSAVPEAEQCGWLKDRYGVSWQIVPNNIEELLKSPGAYGRLLEMTKLVIAEF